MDLHNATPMRATFTLGLDPDGTERIVVVVKGTFSIPPRGGVAPLAAKQDDFVFADTFTGKPGFSAVVHECDFAPFKPRCDVLLNGSAYAPGARPVDETLASLKVAAMTKTIHVVGDRHWTAGVGGVSASRTTPFVKMPLSYDRAFGGPGDVSSPETPGLTNAYAPNPVGVGYFKRARDTDIFAKPLPNVQEPGDPVVAPDGSYRPISFGPLGRNFAARYPLAGTYDDAWLADVFPFLPADFDLAYYQAAPPDQQIPYPTGGEAVALMNLTAQPAPPFLLPDAYLPIEISRSDKDRVRQIAVLDTIVLEPDRGCLNLVWRTSLPLRDNIREITQIVIGQMPGGWYRARYLGKQYFPSLGALVKAKRKRG